MTENNTYFEIVKPFVINISKSMFKKHYESAK